MGVEVCFDLLGQLQPGLVLRVSVGVHQDRCRCMTCVALHRLEVTVRLQELVGGTGVPQTMEHDLLKLRVLGSPQAVPFRQQLRCNGQAVRQPEQLPAVAVFLRGVLLVLLQLFKLCQQFFLYPMQTVMRLSRYGAEFDNKKSPHNNLNLTIPSGMALVRVCYVAIRKSKTCSGSFRSRAGTLSKYVILNCRDRLPQKSSHVNVNLSGARPLHLAAQDRSVA